ncbi:hypothetical protein AAMO2058_001288800 [Amorphochlora amoebiformis]
MVKVNQAREKLLHYGIEISPEQVKEATRNVVKVLGRVSNSTLTNVNILSDGDPISVQIVDRRIFQEEEVIGESKIRCINHENVIRNYMVVNITEERIAIVMERKRGRTMETDIDRYGLYTEEELRPIVRGILLAMEHLHACGIVVQNIEAHNVLVSGDRVFHPLRVKLACFSEASSLDNETSEFCYYSYKIDLGELYFLIREVADFNVLSKRGKRFLDRLNPDNRRDRFKSTTEALKDGWLLGVKTGEEEGRERIYETTEAFSRMRILGF